MLQIIGWLGCLYLVVKAMEIAASSSFRDELGHLKPFATGAILVAWIGAVGFALWLGAQGGILSQSRGEPVADYTTEKLKGAAGGTACVMAAKTMEDIQACERAAP